MIRLTRFNGSQLVLNALLIEMIEATPDTVVSLTNGKKIVVREGVEEIVQLATAYYNRIGLVGYKFVPAVEETNEQ
jgi:flagellar protein FlbD